MDTQKTVHTIEYLDGEPCPVCERPRVWRRDDDDQWICGTGPDSGRVMRLGDACWTCRADATE